MRMFVNISIGLALGFGTFAIVLITIFVYRYLKEKMVTAQPAPPSQTNKQVDSRIAKMLVFYFTLFLFYVILVIVASVYTEANGIRWNFLVLVLAVCHMVAGWKVIGPREQAIMVVFGWVVKKLNSGPVFIPWPAHKIPFTKLNIKVDFGTALDPETKEKAR